MNNESNTKELWGVVRREEAKDLWTRIGTAFENKDGSWSGTRLGIESCFTSL